MKRKEMAPAVSATLPPVPEPSPPVGGEMAANLLSRALFYWVQPLFTRASRLQQTGEALQEADLIPLPDIDQGSIILEKFRKGWKNEEMKRAKNKVVSKKGMDKKVDHEKHLRRTLFSIIGLRFAIAGAVKFINTCLQFTFPLLVNAVLIYIEGSSSDILRQNHWRGYRLAGMLFVAMLCKALTENMYFHLVTRCGYQTRVAVSVSVYDKALRLTGAERLSSTVGELVNLMQVDATKIEMFIPQVHVLWDGMFQIIGYMTILYTLIGWPCFVGLGVMIIAGPLQGIIMGKLFGMNRKMAKYTDARVNTTNEFLQGITCVKMYSWEENFEKNIGASRAAELGFLKNIAYLRGFSRSYMGALPGIVAVASFIAYATTNGTVTASTLFAALVAFDQLKFPLLFYPMALAQLAQAKVSVDRVSSFLGMAEGNVGKGLYVREDTASTATTADLEEEKKTESCSGEIVVEGATVYWSSPDDSEASISSKKDGPKSSTDDKNYCAREVELEAAHSSAILSDINLKVEAGQLCAVIGRVGCGKSTLCSAILNEAILGEGKISVKGAVAYAGQSAWILNATVRDNILFGRPFDQKQYDAVIEACQLTHDLKILNKGDLTEIGERGINLSGGQKQRISIARAAYSDAEILILDDPLSALDPAVGQQVFEDCILGIMGSKTCLLVTNQLQCLKRCDRVICLGNGCIIEQGTPGDLMNASDGEMKRLLKELQSTNSTTTQNPESEPLSKAVTLKIKEPTETQASNDREGKLTSKEERALGAVKFEVYKKYLLSGGGFLRFAFIYFSFVLNAIIELLKTAWISFWTSDSAYETHSAGFYMGSYALISVAVGVLTFVRSLLLAKFGVKASENLHNKLLQSVLRSPQSFFDTTPTGRILSRFSKDMYSIDIELSDYFDFFLFCSLFVVIGFGAITYATPWFGIAIIPLLALFIMVLNYYRNVSRETKRLESISRSPVFSHFSETIGGLATIRAYNQSLRFTNVFIRHIDINTQAFYCNKSADRWLSVRIELLGSVIAGLAAFFAMNVVVQADSNSPSTENFSSIAGLSLTYAISMTGLLNWVIRSFSQLEAGMNATERVLFYSENISQEAARSSDELEKRSAKSPGAERSPSIIAVEASGGDVIRPPPEWPTKGDICLNNLVMRYRRETPIVLKSLSVSIVGGERIGVVGRTGSGKSSLLLSLMRIVEPELSLDAKVYNPPISIDGVDVLRIGLNELRSKIGIIPQNPVLFSGSFRSNLDPFEEYNDDQIWTALDACAMKSLVEQSPGKLDGKISEYGENLSQGQRQLLCLGRALLKQCQILLLDEATSSVDFETDREIQKTLRTAFDGSTVLTVAHRVNTIMDSDKILVMVDGVGEEFASPNELLKNKDSLFSEIVRHAETETR